MARRMAAPILDANLMAWEPLEVKGGEGRAWIKTLSKNTRSGARTALIKFDAGYKQARTVSIWPVDMYVLEGGMECGPLHFQKSTFHYRPAGVEFGPIHCPQGVTRLIFTAESRTRASRQEVFIPSVDAMPWGPSYADPTGKRQGLKVLRQDTRAQASVLMSISYGGGGGAGTPHHIVHGTIHQHPHIEESFIMEGEFQDYHDGIDGHVRQGAMFYGCREPYSNAHGDPTVYRYPVVQFIRRGWTGDWMKYYETYHNLPVPRLDFVE